MLLVKLESFENYPKWGGGALSGNKSSPRLTVGGHRL